MHFDRRSFLGAAASLAALPTVGLAAPPATGGSLSAAAIGADLDLLRHAFETVHPGLRRYLPSGGLAERVDRMKRWAAPGRTQAKLYVALARLTNAVRCGHTYPNPNNQRRAVERFLLSGRDRVPFTFRWLQSRMIVTGARGAGPSVQPGTEILAVDGVAARDLFRAMLPLTRADGRAETKRIAQLGVTAAERYPAFDVYRPMLFPVRPDGTVRIVARMDGGPARSLELPALTEAELQAAREGRSDAQSWTFALDRQGVGTLTMPDWVTYRSTWDWKAWLDGVIDRLIGERARGLVIDLRGNEGGTECGWHLLERLVTRDLPLPRFVYKTRYRTLPEALHQPLDTWDPSFRDWGASAAGPETEGFYVLTRKNDMAGVIAPRGRRFAGTVAVLVDGACSSATFQFASVIKDSGVALLIGEPTGGSRRGINGGAYFFVRLPETGLEVDLPIIGSFPLTPQPDAGIIPDRRITPTQADLAAGRDHALAAARMAVLRGAMA